MISLHEPSSIEAAAHLRLDPKIQRLIAGSVQAHTPAGQFDLSSITHVLLIEPGDAEADIEEEVGFSPLVNPLDGNRFGSPGFQPWWDWLQDRDGWFELIVTMGNSGFAFVLLIQDREGVLPDLLSLCRTYAE